jgi:transcriptional regulator with XRE-family HTH domain
MPSRRDPVAEAAARGRRLIDELGSELRDARVTAGVSQRTLASRLRSSQAAISRVELGTNEDIGLVALGRQAAALGLTLHVRLYPGGSPLRDQAQLALISRLRSRLNAAWRVDAESPIPLQGDLRAWDLLLSAGDLTIGVEAVTRLRDVQALLRAVRHKQRDGGVTRVLIVLAATHANRHALARAGTEVTGLSVGTKTVMAALAAGRDPRADAIVLL